MNSATYDLVGIGIGPFNLGLACLSQPLSNLRSVFFDKEPRFDWHPGMLLENATLQTPFMGDLVTLADPSSSFSFLRYIKEMGRIYSFYTRENFFLERNEYNQYCKWATEKLSNVQFGHTVKDVRYCEDTRLYRLTVYDKAGSIKIINSRKLVLGTGTSPYIPDCCTSSSSQVTHSSRYLMEKDRLQASKSITIVGSGQSAAEIYHDLLLDIDKHGYQLDWITRSSRFFPLDLTKLNLEMTSPDYAQYFYNLPEAKRAEALRDHAPLFKGINASLIKDIYDTLYRKRLVMDLQTRLIPNSELVSCTYSSGLKRFSLEFRQREQNVGFGHETESLVLATGYENREPEFLAGVERRIKRDSKGRFAVGPNYAIDQTGDEIFVQNCELHTHGFVAPDLGMACLRNATILRAVLGLEVYPIEKDTTFQTFDISALTSPSSSRVVASHCEWRCSS